MAEVTPVREYCREVVDHERCNAPADLILWGKLFPQSALGPRCLHHAAQYMPTDAHSVGQYAVFDLRKVAAAYLQVCEERDELAAGRAAVKELHYKNEPTKIPPWCGCCGQDWPCNTIRALGDSDV